MKRGRGRCTLCGHATGATLDNGQQYFETPSGRERPYQVRQPEWLSDCCNASTEMWEEDR